MSHRGIRIGDGEEKIHVEITWKYVNVDITGLYPFLNYLVVLMVRYKCQISSHLDIL